MANVAHNVLCVANKRLPANDYRVAYAQHSQICSVTYALPGKPETLEQGRYVYIGMREGLRPGYVYHLFRLWKYLYKKRRELDVVHFYSTVLILLGPILARCAGLPSIISLTGFGRVFTSDRIVYRLLRPLYMLLLRTSMHLTSRVVFQNHEDLLSLTERFKSLSHKFRYVGGAVCMPITQDKSFSAPRLRVLHVARLMPDKGIEDFLRVAEALQESEFEFVLVGPESIGFRKLLDRVWACHNRGIVDYRGELNLSATLDQFSRAHVLFFPSYGEGMARVMLEAGFTQVCPVTYDIPANRDLIAEGRGFLVQRGDFAAVIGLLEFLVNNRDVLMTNAIAYQKHVLTHYNIEAFARRMDEVLSDMMLKSRKNG